MISITECGGIHSTANCIAVQGNNSYLIAGSATKFGDPAGDLYYMETDNTVSSVPTVSVMQPRVYPNPVHHQALIIILPETEAYQYINMEVMNAAGTSILKQNNVSAKDLAINAAAIPAGTYFYRIVCKDGTVYNGKFVIE